MLVWRLLFATLASRSSALRRYRCEYIEEVVVRRGFLRDPMVFPGGWRPPTSR